MVLDAEASDDITANHVEMAGQPGDAAITGRPTPTRAEAPVDGLSLERQSPFSTGLSEESSDIVLASRRVSTKRQYLVYVHKII